MAKLESVVEKYPIPDRIPVYRNGQRKWVMIEPNHPRFSMSMAREVKEKLTEEDRYVLAEELAVHFDAALAHWADEPITVHVSRFDLHLDLSDNPDDPGKMLVRPG